MAATPIEKAVKSARTRHKNAALKALRLLADITAQQLGLLEQGAVPEASIMTLAVKYDQALTAMRTADTALGGAGGSMPEDGQIEVSRTDLALLIQVLRAVVPAPMLPEGGPLATLEAAVAGSQAAAEDTPAS
jgi:hypothetical protein